MRRKDKEISSGSITNEILTKSVICRLGLFDGEYPYIVPMNYGYKDNALYFHCARKGKKVDLIKRNSKAGFEIEQGYEIIKNDISCKWTTRYRSIIGTGTVEIITDSDRKKEGLNIIMKQHGSSTNVYNDKSLENVLVLKLEIGSLSAKQSEDWDL